MTYEGNLPSFIFSTIAVPAKAEWPDVVIALFTVGLFGVAWWQLGALRKTAYADFAHRLNADFFTDKCDEIRRRIVNNQVLFRTIDSRGIFEENGVEKFDDTSLDRHVLGPLEAVGIFQKRHFLDLEFVYDMFGSSIIEILQSPEVGKYIAWTRQQPNSRDVYDCLLFLNRECLALTKAKERGYCSVIRWKFTSTVRSWVVRR